MRHLPLVAALAIAGAGALSACGPRRQGAPASVAPPTAAAPPVGAYAEVNGLSMYYEVHGRGGRPLVLLHGSFCTIACFGPMIPTLAAGRQVIAIEQQGHGRTADIDRPLTIAQMADDTVALLTQLGITNADFLGYSMGSSIAVVIALQHPELVRKLTLVSLGTTRAGYQPALREGIEHLTPEMFHGSPVHAMYLAVAPEPDHFPRLVEKIKRLELTGADIPVASLAAIKAPTLLVSGDSDSMQPEHTVELFRALGGGVAGDLVGLPRSQLAVIPGATHIGVLMEHPAMIAELTLAFLDRDADGA